MKSFRTLILALVLLPLWAAQTVANPIYYEINKLTGTGSSWEYTYTVDNNHSYVIDEFTVYFNASLYENLLVTGSPSDWDGFAAQPEPGQTQLQDLEGFADWAVMSPAFPIASGEMLGGFSVSFDYLGTGTPGSQFFETFGSNFTFLSDGNTEPLPPIANLPTPVPAPASIFLLGIGLTGLFVRKSVKR